MADQLLTPKENNFAAKFVWDHYAKHGKTASLTLTTKATGLGFNVIVKCPYCKETLDITDRDSW